MPSLSKTSLSVPASGIRRIFELANELDDVIQLSIGEPEIAVAPHILEAGSSAWSDDVTNYTPNSGMALLRTAIAEKLQSHNGYAVDHDQIHVTAGGAQALHMAMCMTLSSGDEVLVPNPGYATFTMAAKLVGAVPVPYELTSERGFTPSIEGLEKLVTANTKALLVNSPSNPLGVVYSREVLAELLNFAARNDLWIISDEVYEYLTFGSDFLSMAAIDRCNRVFGVYSLSKTYALTGARVGYLVTPPGMAEVFRAAQEAIVSCVNTASQLAAVAAIGGDQSHVAEARNHYRSNIEAACRLLDDRGLRYQKPGGAFYLWIDVSHASQGDVAGWAEQFLIQERVAVAPGTAFGSAGEGWIRISLAGRSKALLEALGRLPAAAGLGGIHVASGSPVQIRPLNQRQEVLIT
ncbi:pyridoxal phosphate-dependent aminotransferase [Pseudarthrobacter sp. NPDC058119]|uniref:pyridoxal phosphate-dependent aminotransferase n=1 Tax=Pseudarthrobacter sp. NPDC058119 TaxID=3346348 RepID=UPI0036DCE924